VISDASEEKTDIADQKVDATNDAPAHINESRGENLNYEQTLQVDDGADDTTIIIRGAEDEEKGDKPSGKEKADGNGSGEDNDEAEDADSDDEDDGDDDDDSRPISYTIIICGKHLTKVVCICLTLSDNLFPFESQKS